MRANVLILWIEKLFRRCLRWLLQQQSRISQTDNVNDWYWFVYGGLRLTENWSWKAVLAVQVKPFSKLFTNDWRWESFRPLLVSNFQTVDQILKGLPKWDLLLFYKKFFCPHTHKYMSLSIREIYEREHTVLVSKKLFYWKCRAKSIKKYALISLFNFAGPYMKSESGF